MKSFPIAALLLVSSLAFAQKKIEIIEGTSAFSTGSQNALSFIIHNGNMKDVTKAWEKKLKDLKGKVSNKKELFADDCSVKEMGANSFDVYSKVEEALGEGIRVYAAFDLGGAYLSMAAHPDKYMVAKNILYAFALEQNKEVVRTEIELAKKILSDREAELFLMAKTQTQLEAEIVDCLKRIEESRLAIVGLGQAQIAKKLDIDAQKAVVFGLDEKMKAVN